METIWPLSSVACKSEISSKGILPLRTFIQETLRRSRTSYSTLQVALYYLVLVRPHVPAYDFTMEQPDDAHSSRVLQCGRRMFLAALILASKYLQDRNFSARAWSKISGLNTKEINQNEIAFLFAVGWKLHITDEVFQRWTEIVLKFTPHPQLVTTGSPSRHSGLEWKQVIMQLNPELDNIGGLISQSFTPKQEVHSSSTLSQRKLMNTATSISRSHSTPVVLEPNPVSACRNPGRPAPSLGLLPTPRLTPQNTVYSTPAVSAATVLLSKSSMATVMSHAPSLGSQSLEKWPISITSSPCPVARRSSLATSVSTASSPESMVSDSSRTSRSSSISSASSLVSAPSTKLDIQARCRYAKLRTEGHVRPTIIASVAEDADYGCITSSPETYLNNTTKNLSEMDDSVADAARALQSLHKGYTTHSRPMTASSINPSYKRTRANSADDSVQENVRSLLRSSSYCSESAWPRTLVRDNSLHASAESPSRKRLCCSAEASLGYARRISLHPLVGGAGGPGMWTGILDD